MKSVFSQALAAILKPLVEIRSGERMKTLLMFFYFFLTISIIYVLKPVRSALFLEELGAKNLRYVYIGEGIFLIFVVAAYIQFAKRVSKKILYAGVLGFFMTNLFIFWAFFRAQTPYLSAFFYVWVASFSITMTTQFWMLANDIFTSSEAKRLFGLIISGGSAGGIAGGILTQQLVRGMKTEDLLLVAAVIVGGCTILVGWIWKIIARPGDQSFVSAAQTEKEKKKAAQQSSQTAAEDGSKGPLLRIFTRSDYLLMLTGLVMIAKMASTIVDNQFNKAVELAIEGTEARTAFFGGFLAWLNAVSFFAQLFLTSLALRYLGVGASLAILPIGLTLFSLASFLGPAVLATALSLKLFDGSMNYSIQQAGKEMLFLPLSSALRYRVKPIIDMLGFRAAKSLGGVYIALCAPLFGLSDERLGVLVLILIPLWIFLLWRMRKGYSQLLRSHLLERLEEKKSTPSHRPEDLLSILDEGKSVEEIKAFMNHSSTYVRKLTATACLAKVRSGRDREFASRVMRKLIHHESCDGSIGISARTREYALRYPEKTFGKIHSILKKLKSGARFRHRAVKILEDIPRQESADLLLEMLAESSDQTFRLVILRTLGHLHKKNPRLFFNRSLLKKEIVNEVWLHEKIRKLTFAHRHRRKQKQKEDYLAALLNTLREECLERIFNCLILLYPEEAIRDIYNSIVGQPDGSPLRVHAQELLSNTLESDLLIWVHRILEGVDELRVEEPELMKILREYASSEDWWFSLASFFLLSELGFYERWPGLTRLREDSEFQKMGMTG